MHRHTPIIQTSTKIKNLKDFLFQSTRLSKSLEGLNSSVAQLAGELWLLAKMAKITFRGI